MVASIPGFYNDITMLDELNDLCFFKLVSCI